MSKKLYDVTVCVTTKEGKEVLNFSSIAFTKENKDSLTKFLFGLLPPDYEEEQDKD